MNVKPCVKEYSVARRTKEDACATRNSLLDAAEQVFYEQGWRAPRSMK
jgi:AcrR family transcriptional regulator